MCRIWTSRRSVGVGVETSGTDGGLFVRGSVMPDFGEVGADCGEPYMGFFFGICIALVRDFGWKDVQETIFPRF